jgi:hypothetical protein
MTSTPPNQGNQGRPGQTGGSTSPNKPPGTQSRDDDDESSSGSEAGRNAQSKDAHGKDQKTGSNPSSGQLRNDERNKDQNRTGGGNPSR